MKLVEALAEAPGSVCKAVTDPLGLGYHVVGLPPSWRRTRTDTVDGIPAASWIDSSVMRSQRTGSATGLVFASIAIVMAWRIRGLGRAPIGLAALFCSMTEEVPGWNYRSSQNGTLDAASAAIRLVGTLDSPFGPLIANSHTVVYRSGTDELTAMQLSVTATPDGGDAAGQIALRGAR